jgi:hypothetical protein
MPVHLDDIVTGLQMLGGVLSTPRRVEAQQQQSDIERQLLQGSGMSQADIEAATPQPAMRWLSPQQGGFTGKVLGGVGDVGSLISSIVGKPIAAPRASMSDLADANKMRVAHQKDLAEADLLDKMTHGGTPQEIAALGIKSGHGDAAFRYLGRETGPAHPPGSPFAARVQLQGLDPNSDEYKRMKAALDADQAARDASSEAAATRAVDKYRQEHPDYGSPTQQQHDKFVQTQKDRAAVADQHPEWNPEQKAYYVGHGFPMPAAKPARGMSMKDIALKVAGEMHSERPSIEPDPDELRRRIYGRAKTLTAQGIKIDDFDPKLEPPPEPPPPEKPAAPPEQSWGDWWHSLTGGGTPTPTTPPTSTTSTTMPAPGQTAQSITGLDPEAEAILAKAPLTSRDQVEQVQLLTKHGPQMPSQEQINWALSIAGGPQQQAAPR